MSAELPETLDAWRMVAARREFDGRVPLSSMPRLREALFDAEGEVAFALEFDRDAMRIPYVELRIEAELPLQCQRSLQRFLLPVRVVQRLGLVREEADEAALRFLSGSIVSDPNNHCNACGFKGACSLKDKGGCGK